MPEEVTLRGMTWSDPRGYDPLVAAGEAFRAQHPQVRIDWDKRSLQGFESTPVDELAREYDLMIIDHPHVGAIVEEDCLLPIDHHADTDTLLRLAGESVGRSFESYFYRGHQWALPVDAACQAQAIRPDLMDGPVASFKQVLKHARDGRVVWPLRPPHVLMSFFTLMANQGKPFPIVKGDRIDKQAGEQTLELMQALFDAVDPACREMDPIAALDALAEGTHFALSPLVYLYAPYARQGYKSAPIAYHNMPSMGASGPIGSALGGTGIAISARTDHGALCTEFALWVASAAVQSGLYAQNNGQPGNAIAWADKRVNEPVGNAYYNTRLTHEAAWLRPRYAGFIAFQEEGSALLLDAFNGRTTLATTLDALQSRFDESFPS